MKNNKIQTILRIYFLVGILESLTSLIVLLLLPSDQNSAWLLGYSKNRWILFSMPFAAAVLFFWLFLKTNSKNTPNTFIERIKNASAGVWSAAAKLLIFFLMIQIQLLVSFRAIDLPNQESLVERFLPIFILAMLIAAQSMALFCTLNHFRHDVPWLKTLFHFPVANNWIEKLEKLLAATISKISIKIPRGVLILIFILWAPLFNVATSRIFFGTGLKDFIFNGPDEVKYWIEASAFVAGGFNGGQISIDHGVAKFEGVHFAAQGPFFPVLLGSIGKIIGWQKYTPAVINMALLFLALVSFVLIVKPDKKHLIGGWILLALYPAIYIFIFAIYQQTLHLSFAIIMAALFIKWLRKRDDAEKSGSEAFWLILVVFIATLFRYTWIVIYLPILLVAYYRLSKKKFFTVVGLILFSSLAAYLSASFLWAPYPQDVRFQIMAGFHESIFSGLKAIYGNISKNFGRLLQFGGVWASTFRIQFLIMTIASITFLRFFIKRGTFKKPDNDTLLSLVSAVNILLIFVLNFTFYYIRSWNDYRIWAPHLLISLLLLLFSKSKKMLVTIFLVGFLLLLPGKNLHYFDFADEYDSAALNEASREFYLSVKDYLIFNPEEDRWCNTLEISKFGFGEQNKSSTLTGLTPGFGINSTIDWNTTTPSEMIGKYMLLDPLYMEEVAPGFMDQLDIEYLTSTPLGNLYLNHNSACPE